MLLGCALAVFSSTQRGVYYTKLTLLADVNAELALKSKSFKRLSRRLIPKIIKFISNNRLLALDEAEIKLANKKLIYVISSSGRLNATSAVRLLASQSSLSGRKVVICDTTGRIEKEFTDGPTEHSSGLSIVSVGENLNLMTDISGASFFTSIKFSSTIKELMNNFDQVFICGSNKNNNLGSLALADFSYSLVLIASLRKTRKLDIKKIKKTKPIDLLFYD